MCAFHHEFDAFSVIINIYIHVRSREKDNTLV